MAAAFFGALLVYGGFMCIVTGRKASGPSKVGLVLVGLLGVSVGVAGIAWARYH